MSDAFVDPRLRRVRPPDVSNVDPARSYGVVRFRQRPATGALGPTQETLYETPGNTLFVAEVNGSAAIYVRLDSPKNPWIAVDEGDTLQREFSRFWVRSGFGRAHASGLTSLSAGETEATFYVSFGQLVTRAPKRYGFRDAFLTMYGTCPLTTQAYDAFKDYAAAYTGGTVNNRPAWLKYGGTVTIRNLLTTGSNHLYVFMGTPGAAFSTSLNAAYPSRGTAFAILGGTAATFQFENRISNTKHAPEPITSATLCVAGFAADHPFQITVSRLMVDQTDEESETGTFPIRPLGGQ